MGLREFTNWDIRSDLEDVEPLKKYVFYVKVVTPK